MRRRRWLVITSSFPRGRRDVAGHFVEQWCRALVERGYEIDVLCWRGEGAEAREVMPGLSVSFVPYAWREAEALFFGAGAPENLSAAPQRALLAVPAAASMTSAALGFCRWRDYDGVAGHWLVPGGMIARVVGAMTGLPVRVIGHSGGIQLLGRLPRTLGESLARWICGAPVTVTTAALREQLVRLAGRTDVRVAPMGYESAPEDVRERREGAGDGIQLGFLGRLVPIKGLPTVLRAVKRLCRAGMNVSLEVVGDGPCRAQWEEVAGKEVEFVGARFGRKKWERLAAWDALVMPSKRSESGRHEGLPVSLLEGASVGAVPLVSGVPGVEPWLASPNRQVVDGGVAAWCRALEWFEGLGDAELAELREETRERVGELAWPEYGAWWERWLEGR